MMMTGNKIKNESANDDYNSLTALEAEVGLPHVRANARRRYKSGER